MSNKTGVFDVELNLQDVMLSSSTIHQKKSNSMEIEKALETVLRQMRITGFRSRTISDYSLHMSKFQQLTGIKYLDEITTDTIYEWLGSMNVKNSTKLVRLKCLKAILGKFFDNGWIDFKFWKTINIKVDKNIKKGSTANDINVLLSLLNLNSFAGLRDAVAILTLYKTGVRINTLGQIEEKHIDFEEMVINLDGAILKNHEFLKLPIDDQMINLLRVLIKQNNKIRQRNNQSNQFIFLTAKGTTIHSKTTTNTISKRLNKYAKKYELQNINPHAMRRGFAKNLLNKGASVALISKALGHSDLAVTTQYLDLDTEEVANSLRNFL
ncbi:site-specific recombinase XerD [Filibacter limicola]|uniref:Site-specific recombinase XerD n=1 Tax=Sporosarcina limicola TaxID=34101 RepID=A0A927MQC6_9BACL|nr:site-specific integrase [Sporosarcina limicola]MBE1557037.1 site-specific recombinase XerD [Sporosarcina limicola]